MLWEQAVHNNLVITCSCIILSLALAGVLIGLYMAWRKNKKYLKTMSYNYDEINALYEQLASTEETLRENYTILEEQKVSLELKEEKYQKLFDASTNALIIFDDQRRIVDANPLACSLYYGDKKDLIGKEFRDFIRPRVYKDSIYNKIFDILDKDMVATINIDEDTRSGEKISLVIRGWKYRLKNDFYLLIIDDVTSLNRQDEEIRSLLYYDQITDLPNRMTVTEWIDNKIARYPDTGLSVMLIDLDDFKIVNDTIGHSGGDKFLYDVARRLSIFQSEDTLVARCGGDEFVVAMHNCNDLNVIKAYCDNLLNLFTNPFCVHGREFISSVSIGIALYPSQSDSSDILMKKAELAMYEAEDKGGNQYMIFNDEMEKKMEKKNFFLTKLRGALSRKEIFVVYQPQFSLRTKKICGIEALMRWNLIDHGMVSPGDFIPLAENNGVINALGAFILEESCRYAKKINEDRKEKLIVSVNISVIQLMRSNFLDNVNAIIDRVGVDPKIIGLEITESVVLESFEANTMKLAYLRDKGIKISLDDFGTGYSSLTYLKKLPITFLKIDKAFIDDIEVKEGLFYLLEAIIKTAPLMDLRIIAEGIETMRQFRRLEEIGCEVIQGYLISKPLREAEMTQFLEDEEEILQDFKFTTI